MDSIIDENNLVRKIFTFCNKICVLKLNAINKCWSSQIPNIRLFKATDYTGLKDFALFVALPLNKIDKLSKSSYYDNTTQEYLYSIRLILPIILKNYDGWEGIEIRHEQKANQTSMAAKSKELTDILHLLELKPRQDSVIQKEYITEGKHSLNKVIYTACYMHWLHNYTKYAEDLEVTVNRYAKEVGYYYPGIYYEMGEILQSEVKYQAPTVWPWLSHIELPEQAIANAIAMVKYSNNT